MDWTKEELGKSCQLCHTIQANLAESLQPLIWPDTPCKCIHVDFIGPYLDHMFFIVVDVHLKWPEVEVISTTTSEKTIEVLRSLFAHYGLSEQLISDSGHS